MSGYIAMTDNIARYVSEEMTRESDVQKRLREETKQLPMALMLTTPDQVAFLAMLVRLTGAKNILEIGTFTGYSALALASALPEGGTLIACDVSREWTDIGRKYWTEAGVEGRIDLRLAPAGDTLSALIAQGRTGSFDMAFIDADKPNYDNYYEACLKLLKVGGFIAFDNMLWSGAVADPDDMEPRAVALRTLNTKIRNDTRVDACMVTVADGIMLVRKR